MTFTDHDLSDLLAAVKAGEMTDTVRTSVAWVLQELIEAELALVIGAARGARTDSRLAQRNGHRPKLVSTAAGDVKLGIPKLRTGSFFPAILERRRRIDRALFAVVMEAWVHGVSTLKVDDLVKALGAASGISKSEVSRICAELDRDREVFRTRRLDGAFPYVFADATCVKARVSSKPTTNGKSPSAATSQKNQWPSSTYPAPPRPSRHPSPSPPEILEQPRRPLAAGNRRATPRHGTSTGRRPTGRIGPTPQRT